jgi:hypothetical protein
MRELKLLSGGVRNKKEVLFDGPFSLTSLFKGREGGLKNPSKRTPMSDRSKHLVPGEKDQTRDGN